MLNNLIGILRKKLTIPCIKPYINRLFENFFNEKSLKFELLPTTVMTLLLFSKHGAVLRRTFKLNANSSQKKSFIFPLTLVVYTKQLIHY